MNTPRQLLTRIRLLVAIAIIGLIVSGLTAIPLETELRWLIQGLGINSTEAATHSGLEHWLTKVHTGLKETNERYPFIAYGTDWLAFGHLMIALVFVGAWRDPVRNKWLFDYGLLACAAVIPWALLSGELRDIPFYWRLIDCSFGVFGAIPFWLARQWVAKLEQLELRAENFRTK